MKLKAVLILGGLAVLAIGLFWVRSMNQKNIQVNNQTCPVSGNRVNESDTYVYKGKEYRLCSDKCKHPLSQDPEKYLSNQTQAD